MPRHAVGRRLLLGMLIGGAPSRCCSSRLVLGFRSDLGLAMHGFTSG